MKKLFFFFIYCLCICLISYTTAEAQISYVYPLSSSFKANNPEAPDLIQIPNNGGLTGEFVIREVPETTCGQTGMANGYFFEDDAGLQFDNPDGFIDQSYSVSFNFQIDEFISPPPWVRILSFTHSDDVGLYIALTTPPEYGTLEFWPYGYAGEGNFFSPIDFYQMILVRNDTGLIKVYVNGSEFAEYDDGDTQKYVPQDEDGFIIWFRDHPSVLANEASPGFASDIVLANYPWTQDQINKKWEDFCSELLTITDQPLAEFKLFPNPTNEYLNISVPDKLSAEVEIIDIFGKTIHNIALQDKDEKINVSNLKAGMYFIRIKSADWTITKTFCKN